MRVLMVGSGGYIGRRLAHRLEQAGCVVQRASSGDGTGIDPVTGRLTDRFAVGAGTDVVVYLAQSPAYEKLPAGGSEFLSANAWSALAVAEHARRAGVPRLVYASTGTVYRQSREPLDEGAAVRRDDWYALSKLHGEELLAMYEPYMSVLSCRLFGVYGPGQGRRLVHTLIRRVATRSEVVLQPAEYERGDTGGLRLSLVFIEDLLSVMETLIRSDVSGVLNVASEEVLSIREIAEAAGRQLGITPRFKVSDETRAGDLIADIGRLRRLMAPSFTPFEQGLAATLNDLDITAMSTGT